MSVYQLVIGGNTKRSVLGQHPVEVDFDALPEASRAFVTRYGLKQYLADGMAGAESEADAETGVQARLAKLLSGDLSRTSTGADKPDSETARALKLARVAVRAQAKVKNLALTKEQVDAAAKATVEKNPKWLKEAKRQLAEEAKALAEIGDDDDLLADLT